MDQFRRWAWAGLLGSTLAHGSVDLGSVQIEMNGFTHQDTFEWNGAKERGVYEHKSQLINYLLRMTGTGRVASETLEKPIRIELGAQKLAVELVQTVQLLKVESQLTLQWHMLVFNPNTHTIMPVVLTNRLKLSPQSKWSDFENGGTVDAVIDDPAESQVARNLISDLVEDLYQLELRPLLESNPPQGFSTMMAQPEPRIFLSQVGPRQVRLSKSQIRITTTAERIAFEPRLLARPL